MAQTLRFSAGEKDENREILSVLRADFALSTGAIRRAKHTGGILKNGLPATVRERLQPGDSITFILSDAESSDHIPPEEGELSIIYEDEGLLVLNKPAGIAVHPTGGQYHGTLAGRLAYYFAKKGEPFVFRALNRLDRGTSGLMAVAKNAHTCALLQKQMEAGTFTRSYLALCEGEVPKSGEVCAPIGRAEGSVLRREIRKDGAYARTFYERRGLYTLDGLTFSLVALRLETGRTHQIRVHMASLGTPLLGDFLYGTERPELLSHTALHSAELSLLLPSKTPLSLSVPLPGDLAGILEKSVKIG